MRRGSGAVFYVYLANRWVWTNDSFDFSGQNFTLFHLRETLKNLLIPFKTIFLLIKQSVKCMKRCARASRIRARIWAARRGLCTSLPALTQTTCKMSTMMYILFLTDLIKIYLHSEFGVKISILQFLIFFQANPSSYRYLKPSGRKLMKSSTKIISGHFSEKLLLKVQNWAQRCQKSEKWSPCAKT